MRASFVDGGREDAGLLDAEAHDLAHVDAAFDAQSNDSEVVDAFFDASVIDFATRDFGAMPLVDASRDFGTMPLVDASRDFGTPIAIRDPDWELRGDDAVFSGAIMSAWPALHGPSMTPVPTREPRRGQIMANGHAGVLFPTSGARAESDGALREGVHSAITNIFVWDPDNSIGIGNREYGAYISNHSSSADLHIVFAHQANVVPFDRLGAFFGNDHLVAWRSIGVRPRSGLHFVAQVLDEKGATHFYLNGVRVGTHLGSVPSPVIWTYPVVGGSYQDEGHESEVSEWFKGHIYHLRTWIGTALTDDEIAQEWRELSERYGFDGTEYEPSLASSSLTLWLGTGGRRALGDQWDGSASCYQWEGYDPAQRYVTQGTPSYYAAEGDRIHGRPTLRLGTSAFFAGGYDVQGTLTATHGTAYSFMAVVRPRAIVATRATPVDRRDSIFGDVGDYFSIGVFTDADLPRVSVYHYGGVLYQVEDAGISIGTPVLIHVWYDGLALHLRVGNRPAVSVPAADLGPAGNPRIGWASSLANKFDGDIGEVIFRNAANDFEMNADRAYMNRVWGVDY